MTAQDEIIRGLVKPLRWHLDHRGDWNAHPYRIRLIEGYWIVSGWLAGRNPYDTEDEAKDAAWQDYRARIAAALDLDALAGLVEALETAKAHVANNAQGWSVSRTNSRADLAEVDAALARFRGEQA